MKQGGRSGLAAPRRHPERSEGSSRSLPLRRRALQLLQEHPVALQAIGLDLARFGRGGMIDGLDEALALARTIAANGPLAVAATLAAAFSTLYAS